MVGVISIDSEEGRKMEGLARALSRTPLGAFCRRYMENELKHAGKLSAFYSRSLAVFFYLKHAGLNAGDCLDHFHPVV
jgi:hypothetical protein